jgi:hypothetical protein
VQRDVNEARPRRHAGLLHQRSAAHRCAASRGVRAGDRAGARGSQGSGEGNAIGRQVAGRPPADLRYSEA